MHPDPLPSGVSGYESLEFLGRGGSATVYKARQTSTGQYVALKFPRSMPMAAPMRPPDLLHEALHREARLCASLHHPHVVRLMDLGTADSGHPFCVFEYVPGVPLSEYLRRRGPLPLPTAAALMGRVLDVLSWLHRQRISHGDLKPQNIMVFSSGACLHPKVLDFGSAGQAKDHTPPRKGTPAYSAPERLLGQAPSPAADLYAWGLVFAECLLGRPVLEGMSAEEARRWQLGNAPVVLPAALARHPLGALLGRTLEKDCAHRSHDAARLYRDLLKLPMAPGSTRRLRTRPGRAFAAPTQTPTDAPQQTAARRQVALCAHLQIRAPAGDWDLGTLNSQRSELLHWCESLLRRGGAEPAGTLGDRCLFHMSGGTGPESSMARAIDAMLTLATAAVRRGHLMASAQRLELHLGSAVCVVDQDLAPDQAWRLALNQALLLAGKAPHGAVLLPAQDCRHLATSSGVQAVEVQGLQACRLERR
ncbi:serine/threonine protein kinase [Mitsuaria sp. WAJ17]|uniref:serine/threonine-protein kinase n=1 Tax=Mitsuaria sp. WAJ17 TaxID=2761452 RepID=UPI0016008B97|nr:serine/threonine-protein kinase [Mitsuaria sp. WAJ17]MBB2484559.1 serine/threonine protein kinase [Mitsuaria sp. WAJ17]